MPRNPWSHLTRKMRNGRVLIFVMLASCVPIILLFQNCSRVSTGAITNDSVHESPFATTKVVINEKNFDVAASGGEPTLKPNVKLIAKVNNPCAKSMCGDTANANAISCRAYATGPHPKLVDTFQVYSITAPGELTDRDLKAWSEAENADRACLKGISEEISYKSDYVFNDTSYGNQRTNLSLIGFEDAQSSFQPSTLDPVKVGVIDTGVASDPDIVVDSRSNYSQSTVASGSAKPLFAGDDQTKPNHFHGTFVAGIIAATQNNNRGIAGIAPNAHIYAYGIGNSDGQMSNLEIANAIQGALTDNVEVVNMSFGTSDGGGTDDPIVRDGINDGAIKHVIFVAAAGNSSLNLKNNASVYPAQYASIYPNVISVAASDTNGFRANFSNYGGPTNIMAPGSSVYSILAANLGGGVSTSNGTSFSAPMVAAAVALTVGNLKHRNLAIDPQAVRKLVTITGANLRTDLLNDTINGAYLDLRLLGNALATVQNSTALSATIARGTDAGGVATVQMTITWDSAQLTSIPAGSKLGVFDSTSGCTYSLPCLITSVTWPVTGATCDGSGHCSLSIVLTRANVASMMSSKSDPSGALPLTVAIYNPVVDAVTGKTKATYNLSYSTIKDLRGLSSNTGQPIQGVVESVRMDMSYLYVRGWVCRPLSEEAVPVGLVDGLGTAITSDFAYNYPLMTPHTPIDGGDFGDYGANIGAGTFSSYPHNNAFQTHAMSIQQRRHDTFGASVEGNAQLIIPCGTLTASHGYEIVVPLSQIRSSALAGTVFKVQAGGTFNIPDTAGTSTFTFPEPPSDGTAPNITIARAPASLQVAGTICSGSPSPVVAEITYTSYDYVFALTMKTPISSGEGGFVNDPTLVPTGTLPLPIETIVATTQHDMTLKKTKDTLDPTQTSDGFTVSYLNAQPNPVPNAGVFGPPFANSTTDAEIAQFVTNINGLGLKQIVNGNAVTYYKKRGAELLAGPKLTTALSLAVTNALSSGYPNDGIYKTIPDLWDWYDVGDGFSNDLVGYPMSTYGYSAVATQLLYAYKVKEILRETKKFETPLAVNTVVLGVPNLNLSSVSACGANAYQHTLPTWTLANQADWAPFYTSGYSGFWLNGTQPSSVSQSTAAAAMQIVPLTIRFFQDGKMILHVESDTGSTIYPVPYTF